MISEDFVMIDETYRSGIKLEEYNGIYSLVEAQQGKDDGKIYIKWGFRQDKDRQPMAKGCPWGLKLGMREKAIEHVEAILRMLKGEMAEPERMDDGDIPF